MNSVKDNPEEHTLEERRLALVAECEQQRNELVREVSFMRSPNKLSGGSILHGKLKVPLAIATTVLGMLAASPAGMTPLIRMAMSVYRLKLSLSPAAMD